MLCEVLGVVELEGCRLLGVFGGFGGFGVFRVDSICVQQNLETQIACATGLCLNSWEAHPNNSILQLFGVAGWAEALNPKP